LQGAPLAFSALVFFFTQSYVVAFNALGGVRSLNALLVTALAFKMVIFFSDNESFLQRIPYPKFGFSFTHDGSFGDGHVYYCLCSVPFSLPSGSPEN
jgi:amino acid transporter